MKKNILLITVLLLSLTIYAQPWLPSLEKEVGAKGELTFFEIQNTVQEYYSTDNFKKGNYYIKGEKIKAPGWKQFKRWEWYWDTRVNAETGEFPKTTTANEWNDFVKKYPESKSVSGNWSQLGPDQSDGGYAGIGRINCISFHPTDTNTYWVGSPSGGLWKTSDDGQSWNVLTDQNDVLGVSDIAVPSDFETSNTLYIASGDRDGGSVWTLGGGQYYDNHTVGVLKSTDGGLSWNETALNYAVDEAKVIGRLLIDTTNNQTLLASTNIGIYKTIDGGDTWNKVLTSGYITDMEFKPGNNQTIYASSDNKIYRSIDGGENWVQKYSLGSARIEMAVTKDNAEYIYLIAANYSGGLLGIYKSTNSGESFSQIFNGTDTNHSLLYYYSDGSGSNTGQGTYDLAIEVAPNDTNIVYIGGVNTWKSEDGGYSWNINNMWTSYSGYNFSGAPSVHADKHVLKYRDDKALFEGNDGGIYKSNNEGVIWNDLTNDMVISQFYRIGVSQQSNMVIAGLQDNGTKLFYEGNWYDVKGGDGMECIIDPTDDNVQYGTYVEGEIERTLDGWSSYNTTIISDSINDSDGGWWVTPYMLDPNNSETLYVGYSDVWKSIDRGDHFTKISTISSSSKLRSMAMSQANSGVLYVADKYNLWKTENGGASWTEISGTLPSSNAITYIQVKNTNSDTLWVTFGGYDANRVFESTDGGASWNNISVGLPNIPVFTIIQNKQVNDSVSLYLGTDIGVFIKNGNDDWFMFSDGLPRVMVTELEIYYDDVFPENSKLRAATFGRGLWESDLYDDPQITVNDIEDVYYVSESVTDEIDIPFSIFTSFSSNTFTAYLSDENGDFSSEMEIGSLNSDDAGTINGIIPANIASGINYSVRIKSSSPEILSSASNTFEIVFDNIAPTVEISSSESTTTTASPFDVNITFSEKVFGFIETDVILTNATISDFDDSTAPDYVLEIIPIASGSITIDVPENVVTDSIGNKNAAATQWTISYTSTGIDKLQEYGITIFPNPSNGKFRIVQDTPNFVTKIAVIDLSGKVIYNEILNSNSTEIDLGKIAKGLYILQLYTDSEILSAKIRID